MLAERDRLTAAGHDAGPETICWHLDRRGIVVSRASVARILTRNGRVLPAPRKRPKSSYIRFEADQPNECWQSDFTHYRLADGQQVEVISWLDDHSRFALHILARRRITAPDVLDTFRAAPEPTDTAAPADTPLTERELEVLQLMGRGLSNGEIARTLVISEVTVKSHIGRIFTKLDLRDRAAAIVYAFDQGLVARR